MMLPIPAITGPNVPSKPPKMFAPPRRSGEATAFPKPNAFPPKSVIAGAAVLIKFFALVRVCPGFVCPKMYPIWASAAFPLSPCVLFAIR